MEVSNSITDVLFIRQGQWEHGIQSKGKERVPYLGQAFRRAALAF
jgi:hypothetical protein